MLPEDRLLSGVPDPEDLGVEPSLRPRHLDEYIGQRKKSNKPRGVFLARPPPPARRAHLTAGERPPPLPITSGPVLERAGDLAAILTNLEAGEVLFIDEIHRLGPTVEGILYPALEDYRLPPGLGPGPARPPHHEDHASPFHAGGRPLPRRPDQRAAQVTLRHRAPPRLLQPGRADA